MAKEGTLTERMIAYIAAYEREHACPPTVREIADEAGVSHTTVLLWLKRLVKAGRLKQSADGGQAGRIYSTVEPPDAFAEILPPDALRVLRAAQKLTGEITSEALEAATDLSLEQVREALETLCQLGLAETVSHRYAEGKHQFVYGLRGLGKR